MLSSITFAQPPRFLSLYRRLFGGGAGYWANTRQGNLRMDALTGCPEEAMLALAEISALAHWKMSELRNGSLSVRELIRRGDMIETQLRQRAAPRHAGEGNLTPLDPHLAATTMQFSMTMSGTPSASTSSGVTAHATAISKDEASTVVADIFRETAVLYLHTILSEALPGTSTSMHRVFRPTHRMLQGYRKSTVQLRRSSPFSTSCHPPNMTVLSFSRSSLQAACQMTEVFGI